MGLFPLLGKGNAEPKSLESLSTATGADRILLSNYKIVLLFQITDDSPGRILRALAASGAVKENGHDTYTLPPNYALFADSAFNSSVRNW